RHRSPAPAGRRRQGAPAAAASTVPHCARGMTAAAAGWRSGQADGSSPGCPRTGSGRRRRGWRARGAARRRGCRSGSPRHAARAQAVAERTDDRQWRPCRPAGRRRGGRAPPVSDGRWCCVGASRCARQAAGKAERERVYAFTWQGLLVSLPDGGSWVKRSVAFDRGAEWGFEGSFVVYPFSVWAVPALLDRCRTGAARVAAVGGVSLAGAGCGGFGMGMGDLFGGWKTDRSSRLTQADIDALNRGGPRVAMLLPLSAPGEAGEAARALKEAGELALFESGQPNIILEAKDTQGTPQGAQAAANEAISGGARLIVGPLLSSSVKAVTPLAQSSGIPVVAFSTDQQAASNGVYLLSFLPEQEVD